MSELPPNQPQQSPNERPAMDWREERHRERQMRREARREHMGQAWGGSGAWIGGAVLILIGLIFLLQNFGIFTLQNWWALFILIPAFGAFSAAWAQYQSAGRLTAGARGSLIGGFFMTILAAAFLFGFQWSLFWPVALILGGLAVLLNAILPG